MPDIRVCFTKTGSLQYISHLDLQRAVARMLLRTGLPVAYSEGFNPHPRLNIALPLSVFQEGENELFDFRLTEEVPEDIIAERLRENAFPCMEIKSVSVVTSKPSPKTSLWRLEFETEMSISSFESAVTGEMPVLKSTKKGEKTVDISPMLRFVSCEKTEKGINARFELNSAGNDYLNPRYIAVFLGDRARLVRSVREKILL